MARRIVLHIGLMKSGTSFLQQVMRHNNAELRERGVLFPLPWKRQVEAVHDLIEHGRPSQPPMADDGPWRRLTGAMEHWSGTAVASMEFIGPRRRSKIRQIMNSLPPAELEAVITVRDLGRTIPAMWQEHVQNWGRFSWDEYVAGVRDADREAPGPAKAFWSKQDAAAIATNWAHVLGPERVTVLTVPPPGAPRELLWERFAGILGIDPSGVELDVPSNPSLGLPSLLVLSRLNERLRQMDGSLSREQYTRAVKRLLAKDGLAGRREEPRLGYDTEWVHGLADAQIEDLRALGVRVVGDLEELRVVPVAGVAPGQIAVEDQLAAAVDALAIQARHVGRGKAREVDHT